MSRSSSPAHGRDSSELLFDDIDRPKFYSLLTCASAAIRTMLYPAALVKTRLQASAMPPATDPAARFVPRSNVSVSPSGALHLSAHSSVPHYTGTGNAFATILRTEGKFALYRGFRVNLLGLAVDPIVIGTLEYTRTQLTFYSTSLSPHGDGRWDHSFFFRYILSPSTAITLLSASSAACVGQVIQVPVDVVTQKKQMQMHALMQPTPYTGAAASANARSSAGSSRAPVPRGSTSLEIARGILDAEGVRGLYKGFGVTLLSATPFQAILWAVYWPTQKAITRALAPVAAASADTNGRDVELHLHPDPHTGPAGAHRFSRVIPTGTAQSGGGTAAIVSSGPVPPPLSLDEAHARNLSRDERSYLAMERQHALERERLRSGRSVEQPRYVEEAAQSGWGSLSWREALPAPISAFVASATASLSTQPIDVIKTRLQVHGGVGATVGSTIRDLIRQRGYSGLLSGWYPRILAVSPGATIMMTSYEALKRYSAK